MTSWKYISAACLSTLLFQSLTVHAQTEESTDDSSKLEEIHVLGGNAEEISTPLAPQRVSKERMEQFKYTDVNRALKQVSGVYVREEDGHGLRPNIGLRGTNPDRSKKVTLMEDGILIGPAPYSAPAAYYTPNMNHIEALEVYKGFSAVPYGPNSVGGALNYVTRSIPTATTRRLDFSASSYNTQNYKAGVGGQTEDWGYLLEGSHLKTDGFKELDGGGDTGFKHNDIAGAFRYKLKSDRPQFLTLRLGYSDEKSNETYVGLSEDDFWGNPNRRYSSTAWDHMKWIHHKYQLEHTLQMSDVSFLKSSVYFHEFHRTWYRLDSFAGGSAPSFRNTLLDPTANPVYYQILSGQADSSTAGGGGAGNLLIRNNDRKYLSQGVQTKYSLMTSTGAFKHDIEAGLRVHNDWIDRDHTYDTVQMLNGSLATTGTARQVAERNKDQTVASTLSFQDNISYEQWVFTLAARAEFASIEHTDHIDSSKNASRDDSVFVPGAGALYKITDHFAVRGSVNKATTMSGLDPDGNEVKEESTNYELGMKIASDDQTKMADVTVFYNDYQNITGTCTVSAGCTGNAVDSQYNGGKAHVYGIEGIYAQGFSYNKWWFPIQFNATLIQAQFASSFNSTNAEWGVGTVEEGDPLPYVPNVFYTVTAGAEYGPWKQEIAFVYQGKMPDQSVATDRREIDPFGVIDWTGRYEFSKATTIYAKVDNVLDKEYAVSIRPSGYRPGKPQTFGLGLTYAF